MLHANKHSLTNKQTGDEKQSARALSPGDVKYRRNSYITVNPLWAH